MNILDDKQQEVVLNNDQYLLVIASAGCGKTLTITYKVKYLLENLNYQPQDILCLSFTNEASLSLKKKLKENCNYDLEVKTFHKLALDMLKKSNYQFQIAPENFLSFFLDFFLKEKIFTYPFLMQLILKILKISFNSHNYQKKYQTLLLKKDFLKLINTITQYINLLKTLNYDLTDLKKNILKAKKQEQYLLLLMYALYLDYNNELCSLGLIDFNDMLIKALETNIILPYKFIIVDEYQDTSLIRFKLLQKIINKNQAHLMVVGDDYQSIYNFSGCSLDIFLNFSTYFLFK